MADNNMQLAAMQKDIKQTLKIVLLVNNSLQSFKQDTLIRFDAFDKRMDSLEKNMKDGFAELKDLIFAFEHRGQTA